MSDKSDNVIPPEFRFLQEECGFRDAFRSSSYLELVGGDLRVMFDRGRYGDEPVTVRVASIHDKAKEGTRYVYALGTVRKLVLKSNTLDIATTSEMADFLRAQITTVQSMFSKENMKETRTVLDRLGRELAEKTWPGAYLD